MSLDKDVAKFISDIPIPKVSRRIYTTEEAMAIYKENYRDRIYEELKLKHVQKKIRNKILNRKNVDEDILFTKISIEQEIKNTNISGLLSESEEGEEEGESLLDDKHNDQDDEDEKVYNDQDEKVFNKNNTNKADDNTLRYSPPNKALKFLDLEAEQSGEESEAYEDDGSDISSIVDDQQEDENTAASLYADQKQKDDLEILKKLVGKFKQKNKKKSVKNFEQFEIDDSSSEGEIFSEMPFEEIEIPKEQIKLEFVKEEDFKEIKESGVVFNKKKKYF